MARLLLIGVLVVVALSAAGGRSASGDLGAWARSGVSAGQAEYLVTEDQIRGGAEVLKFVRGGRVLRLLRSAEGFGLGSSSAPAWSSDGKFVAWAQVGAHDLTLWIAAGNGVNPHSILRLHDFKYGPLSFAWSPRGHMLVVAGTDGGGHAVSRS